MPNEQKLWFEDDKSEPTLAEIKKTFADMHKLLTRDSPREQKDTPPAVEKDGGDGDDGKAWSEMSAEEKDAAFQRHLKDDPSATREGFEQKRSDDEVLEGVEQIGAGYLLPGKDEDDSVFVDPEFQRYGRF